MNILLVGINAKFIHSNLAICYLEKYADSKNVSKKQFSINQSEHYILENILKDGADVICFSCYIWNLEIVLNISSSIKKVSPDVKIILGGPEVSFDCEDILTNNDFVDIIIAGEGEEPFYNIVNNFSNDNFDLSKINGITYKNANGEILKNDPSKPFNLEKLPFVYDDLSFYENKIIYYETQRGCPYSCSYCLSSNEIGVRFVDIERVLKELQFFIDNRVLQVKFVDRTFNCNKKHALSIWKYLIENNNHFTNFHMEISVDILDAEMLEVLKNAPYGLFQFEIGVQSTNEKTLNAITRKTDLNKISQNVKLLNEFNNTHMHLDLICGLPFEDYKSFKNSFDYVFELKPHQLQLGFLKLLKGSKLKDGCEEYGISYSNYQPYEVLKTNELSFFEICFLKNVENLVETYYNSGKAINTINYVLNFYETPFDFFEAMALYFEKEDYFEVSHNKMKTFENLFNFLNSIESLDKDVLENYLRFDIFIGDNVKSLPHFLKNNEDEALKNLRNHFFDDVLNVEKYACNLKDKTSRQLQKMCHIEKFEFNVLSGNSEKCEVYIVFNYYEKRKFFSGFKYNEICK